MVGAGVGDGLGKATGSGVDAGTGVKDGPGRTTGSRFDVGGGVEDGLVATVGGAIAVGDPPNGLAQESGRSSKRVTRTRQRRRDGGWDVAGHKLVGALWG